jgi:hypothetical protein
VSARLAHWLSVLLLCCAVAPALADTMLFDQIEAKSGKPLSLEQRYQITKAIKGYSDLQRDRDELLVNEVTRLTGLPPQQILVLAQRGGALLPRVEALLKKKLPAGDAQQLRAAEAAYKTALQTAREKLISRMAAQGSLTPQAAAELLPKFGL